MQKINYFVKSTSAGSLTRLKGVIYVKQHIVQKESSVTKCRTGDFTVLDLIQTENYGFDFLHKLC